MTEHVYSDNIDADGNRLRVVVDDRVAKALDLPDLNGGDNSHNVARDQLRAFIERIERLEEEKQTISDDIKDVYGEAKGTGFVTKAIRTIIKIRKQDKNERLEEESILDTYMQALGMM
jgi:uncharacterized protein (UPF0335 family)